MRCKDSGSFENSVSFWISLGAVIPAFFGHFAPVGLWAGSSCGSAHSKSITMPSASRSSALRHWVTATSCWRQATTSLARWGDLRFAACLKNLRRQSSAATDRFRIHHARPSGGCGGPQSRWRGSRRCSYQRRDQRVYRRYRAGAFRRTFAVGVTAAVSNPAMAQPLNRVTGTLRGKHRAASAPRCFQVGTRGRVRPGDASEEHLVNREAECMNKCVAETRGAGRNPTARDEKLDSAANPLIPLKIPLQVPLQFRCIFRCRRATLPP